MSANMLQPEKIEIVDFKIIKGQINSPFDFEIEKVEGHTFNVDFELGFNLEDKLEIVNIPLLGFGNTEIKSSSDKLLIPVQAFTVNKTILFLIQSPLSETTV